jgi:hypothetical protein
MFFGQQWCFSRDDGTSTYSDYCILICIHTVERLTSFGADLIGFAEQLQQLQIAIKIDSRLFLMVISLH